MECHQCRLCSSPVLSSIRCPIFGNCAAHHCPRGETASTQNSWAIQCEHYCTHATCASHGEWVFAKYMHHMNIRFKVFLSNYICTRMNLKSCYFVVSVWVCACICMVLCILLFCKLLPYHCEVTRWRLLILSLSTLQSAGLHPSSYYIHGIYT